MLPRAFQLPILMLLLLATGTAMAAEPARGSVAILSQDPAALFIRDVGRKLPQVVGDAATIAEKRRRLAPFIAEVVDTEAMARFCLGRYWQSATGAERSRYESLFLQSIVNNVAARMGNYQDGLGHVVVEPPVSRPDGTYVPTLVKGASTPEARVAWVVEADRRPMRIVDVVAEGMSLRLAKRDDFVAYLSRHDGNIAALLDALQRQTAR